jgi:uncharacterized membrane protein YfcA
MKKGLVNYRLALLYNLWDIPGVILGGFITVQLAGNVLAGICGSIIILLAILLFRNHKKEVNGLENNFKKDFKEENKNNSVNSNNKARKKLKNASESKFEVDNPYIASLSSFSGGLITGLVGLGGGTADTTSMVLLGMDPKKAAATSIFAMASTAFFGVFVHIFIGTYKYSLLWPLFMFIGMIIGGQIGTYLSNKLDNTLIRKILACLATYTGLLLILLMFGIGWTA